MSKHRLPQGNSGHLTFRCFFEDLLFAIIGLIYHYPHFDYQKQNKTAKHDH
jgi:hypothetical protein